jgi:hypothetical protein
MTLLQPSTPLQKKKSPPTWLDVSVADFTVKIADGKTELL